MKYTIFDIAHIVDGTLLQSAIGYSEVEHLLLDSRQVLFPATALFFAVSGARHNAHLFIPQLYAEGVRNFIISEKTDLFACPEANFIRVANTLEALQMLAAHHRRQFRLPIIGITGSNGKTIIKEWLFQLLRKDYHIVRSPRSYNSQFGVPLSVWQIQPEHNLGIFEAGISQCGEMVRLAPIVDCTMGLFTNIGDAHAAGFASMEEKVHEKAQLFKHADIVFYCKDHALIHAELTNLGRKTCCWSQAQAADLQITKVNVGQQQTRIEGIFQATTQFIHIPFTDSASIENAIHCWLMLLYLGVTAERIQEEMAQLEPVAMRLELKPAINNCIVVNDSYNSDLNSLTLALNFLEQQRKQKQRTLILSDILQSGEAQETLYAKVAQLISEKKINRLIAIGQAVAILQKYLPSTLESHFFEHTDALLDQFENLHFQNEAILLKGARQFTFERIADRLALKAHQTVLEINLQNMVRNLYLYSRYLRPGVRTMVMVKAAAYGSGAAEVARLLEFHGVDYLAVAYADEGIELRKEGIHAPIMVLNPQATGFDAMHRHHLEPEIYAVELLEAYTLFSKSSNGKRANFPIHLKIDTGMHRLGLVEKDLPAVLHLLQTHPEVRVQSIFTHLAASEAPAHDAFTLEQLQRFAQMYEQIAATIGYRPLRHALNTAGVHRFPDWQMDMVRLGIGLYGLDNYSEFREKLFNVLCLKATISQVHELQAGDTVGYGRRWRAERASRIGTISIGYADGLRRAAGNGRFSVWLHEQRAPIVGTVAMDMCMIDLTDIPQARAGDEVEIFGEHIPVSELAKLYDTIPLEVFTTISERVKRVYVQE